MKLVRRAIYRLPAPGNSIFIFPCQDDICVRSNPTRARRALSAILDQVVTTDEETGEEFPYVADPATGEWRTTPDGDWCGGHWIGLLWLAAERAEGERRKRLLSSARSLAETMAEELPEETMFRGMNALYAGFRGYDVTGDRELFGLGLAGADAMIDYYDERSRQIPLGEFQIRGPDNFRGEPIEGKPPGSNIGAVDNVYTALPVLWRAYRETGDPTFRDVAVSHADRHLDWYVRVDGSTWHHAVFDETGALTDQYNELADSDETCWARGQGWNIAGLARAYRETGAERYLRALERTTEYYVENSPQDLVPYWDFESPEIPDTYRDTSAAALAAYGLARLPNDDRIRNLRETGEAILASLVDSYVVLDESDPGYGIVQHGCYNAPGEYAVDNGLVWTDYYVAYTLAALLEQG